MVLGKDHDGRVKGKGGIRLGLKKVFGEEYSATRRSSSVNVTHDYEAIKSSIREELMEEMKGNFAAILERMGLPSLEELCTPGDRLSQRDASTPNEAHERIPDTPIFEPPILELEVHNNYY